MDAAMESALAALRERLAQIGEATPRGAAPGEVERLRNAFPGGGTERLCAWFGVCDGAALDGSFLLPLTSRRGRPSVFSIRESVPLPDGWLPIGGDRFGNWYCAPCDDNLFAGRAPVAFVEGVSPDIIEAVVASDAAGFVMRLVQEDWGEERWPCNRSYVLEVDPRIAAIALPKPWAV